MVLGPSQEGVPLPAPLDEQLTEHREVVKRSRSVLDDFYYADDLAAGRAKDRRRQPRPSHR